jgi:hypothetical protein
MILRAGSPDLVRVHRLFEASITRGSARGDIGLAYLAETGTGEPEDLGSAFAHYAKRPDSAYACDRAAALAGALAPETVMNAVAGLPLFGHTWVQLVRTLGRR